MNDQIPPRYETNPTAPDGYDLYTGPCKWQQLPKGSLVWLPSRDSWAELSEGVSAIPGDSFYYAIPIASDKVPISDYAASATKSVLEEAHDLVNGDRQQSYGAASESFERIADFWHAYLKTKLKDTEHISAKDVASMMILMKVSRSVTSDKRDNWVDIAGYAELGSKLEDG